MVQSNKKLPNKLSQFEGLKKNNACTNPEGSATSASYNQALGLNVFALSSFIANSTNSSFLLKQDEPTSLFLEYCKSFNSEFYEENTHIFRKWL